MFELAGLFAVGEADLDPFIFHHFETDVSPHGDRLNVRISEILGFQSNQGCSTSGERAMARVSLICISVNNPNKQS